MSKHVCFHICCRCWERRKKIKNKKKTKVRQRMYTLLYCIGSSGSTIIRQIFAFALNKIWKRWKRAGDRETENEWVSEWRVKNVLFIQHSTWRIMWVFFKYDDYNREIKKTKLNIMSTSNIIHTSKYETFPQSITK